MKHATINATGLHYEEPRAMNPRDAYQSHCPRCKARPGEGCRPLPHDDTIAPHQERIDKERRRQETARQNHDRNHDKGEQSR